MKGVVFTPDQEMYIKDFGQPLYVTAGEEVGGWIEVVHPTGCRCLRGRRRASDEV